MTALNFINESSILHLLRQRYGNNLIHTFAGPELIVINPFSTLPIYSDKVLLYLDIRQDSLVMLQALYHEIAYNF